METTIDGQLVRKYCGVSLGVILLSAFILVQPIQLASAVEAQDLEINPDSCLLQDTNDNSMNTIRSGSIAKTIHAEKSVWRCTLEQGNLPVIVDVTIFIEIFANIPQLKVIAQQALVVICFKDPSSLEVITCSSGAIQGQKPFLTGCVEDSSFISHPQQMNTVNKGSVIYTIEAQKEVFFCNPPNSKVDTVMFLTIFDDLDRLSVQQLGGTSLQQIETQDGDNIVKRQTGFGVQTAIDETEFDDEFLDFIIFFIFELSGLDVSEFIFDEILELPDGDFSVVIELLCEGDCSAIFNFLGLTVDGQCMLNGIMVDGVLLDIPPMPLPPEIEVDLTDVDLSDAISDTLTIEGECSGEAEARLRGDADGAGDTEGVGVAVGD